LANTGILNLLYIPQFGSGWDENKYIKQLMVVTHEGYLWFEEPVSIDVVFIAFITGLPSPGENLTQYLNDKTNEKVLVEEMKNTYGIERG
jgi:hypothetical protein